MLGESKRDVLPSTFIRCHYESAGAKYGEFGLEAQVERYKNKNWKLFFPLRL